MVVSRALLTRLAPRQRLALQDRRTTIKDKDGPDAEMDELEYAPEKTEDVCIGQRATLLIAHRHLEMVEPDGAVYGKPLSLERLESGIVMSQERHQRVIVTFVDNDTSAPFLEAARNGQLADLHSGLTLWGVHMAAIDARALAHPWRHWMARAAVVASEARSSWWQ